MEPWANVLITGLEMIAILFTYDAYFPRRIHKKWFWVVTVFLFTIHYWIVQKFDAPIGYIKILVITFLLLGINLILYHGNVALRVLITTIAYAMLCLIEFVGQYLSLLLLRIDYEEYSANQPLYVVCGILAVLFCIGLASLLKCFHSPEPLTPRKGWLWGILSIIFPAASLVMQYPLFYLAITHRLELIWILLSCIVMIVCNIFVLWVINLLERNIRIHENSLALSEQIEIQAENIEALSAAYSNQRKMTHDFQQHLQTLSGMLQRGETEQAQKYIFQLQERQREKILLVNTHNAAMDAILNQKAYAAKRENIDVHFEVNDLSRLQIKSIDYTIVIANLLDNAIEACRKLKESERWITVKVLYDKAYRDEPPKLFVSIVNSSPLVQIVNDTIASTKENPELHGFGIPNIKKILSRYDAVSFMQYQDGTFQFSIDWLDKAV